MSKAWLCFGAAILFLVLALTFSSVVFGVLGGGCGAIGFYLLKQGEYDIKPEHTGGRSIFVEPAPFLPKTQTRSSDVRGGNPLSLTHNSQGGSAYSRVASYKGSKLTAPNRMGYPKTCFPW